MKIISAKVRVFCKKNQAITIAIYFIRIIVSQTPITLYENDCTERHPNLFKNILNSKSHVEHKRMFFLVFVNYCHLIFYN